MNRESTCGTNIRPKNILQKYRKLAAREEAYYLDPETGAVRVELGRYSSLCQACQTNLPTITSQGYTLCRSCGTFNSAPRIHPKYLSVIRSERGSANFFHKYVYSSAIESRRTMIRNRLNCVKNYLVKGKVLEVGCSIGLFLDLLKSEGFEAEGVEIIPYAIRCCKEKGHTIHSRPIEELNLSPYSFDAIFAWEVIAHLENPELFLANAHNALRKDGLLFLTTPNSGALEYDTIWQDNLRRHPNLKPHVFLQLFSLIGLRKLLEENRFTIKELTTPGKMDLINIREQALRDGVSFNCRFFNDLFLGERHESKRLRNACQSFLTKSGFSGHMYAVAERL